VRRLVFIIFSRSRLGFGTSCLYGCIEEGDAHPVSLPRRVPLLLIFERLKGGEAHHVGIEGKRSRRRLGDQPPQFLLPPCLQKADPILAGRRVGGPNLDPGLDCAPWGGQDQAADLTVCRAW
jgi:hypothetical protein